MRETFFGTRGNRNASIAIIGEAWGAQEAEQQQPFVGPSGNLLDQLLGRAGIDTTDCFFTNLAATQPAGNKMSTLFNTTSPIFRGLQPNEFLVNELQRLETQLALVKPRVIIGLGNYPLWYFQPSAVSITKKDGVLVPSGIGKWRGSQLQTNTGLPFLPTYHPAATFRNPAFRPLILHDFRSRVPQMLDRDAKQAPIYQYLINPNLPEVLQFLSKLPAEICVDLETSKTYHITACGIGAPDCPTILCIPFTRSGQYSYWSEDEEFQIVRALRDTLSMRSVIGQNFLYDAQVLHRWWGIHPRISWDTMVAHHLCWPGEGGQGIESKSLGFLSSLYRRHHVFWKDERHTSHQQTFWQYNCKDVEATMEIAEAQHSLISKLDLQPQSEFQMWQVRLALQMLLRGIRVSAAAKARATAELESKIKQTQAWLSSIIPQSEVRTKSKAAWYDSPKQTKDIFTSLLQRRGRLRSLTGSGKDVLPKVAAALPWAHRLIEQLLFYRSLHVYYSTFATARVGRDGRIHSKFNPAGTKTFRWSSRKTDFGLGMNLQNIPRADDTRFPSIRSFFIPDDGYLLISADLQGADAQVLAWDAGDTDLMQDFAEGKAIHVENCRKMFPRETRGLSDPQIKALPLYHQTKQAIHATDYGVQAETLSREVGWSYAFASRFIQEWLSLHPAIHQWHRRIQNDLATRGYIQNQLGYRCTFTGWNIMSKAFSWIPQSTVALVTFKGAQQLLAHYPLCQILLQLHDELIFQIPLSLRTELPQIQKCLHFPIPYPRPLTIPWTTRVSEKSWGEMIPVEEYDYAS